MQRGGARIGAGRKRGALTQKTLEIAEMAIEKGGSPLEGILSNRDFWGLAANMIKQPFMDVLTQLRDNNFDSESAKKFQVMILIMDRALSANLAAAPYCHPRQGSLAVFEPVSGKMEHSPQYLESLIQTAAEPKNEPRDE